MRIPSNAIILDLLALHTALDNKALDIITEKFESILNMLGASNQAFDDIEPIHENTKKAIADAGYLIEESTNPVSFLLHFILTLSRNKLDSDFALVILMRLITNYNTIPEHLDIDLQNTLNQIDRTPPSSTSLSDEASQYPTSDEEEINSAASNTHDEESTTSSQPEKNKSEVDIITELTQNLSTPENDSEQKADLLHALFTRTIDAATQQNMINIITQASKAHTGCLLKLKQTINYYLTSNPERLAEAKAIRTNKTSLSNGLLFIEHIGQTHFEIHKNGNFLEALDKFAKGDTLKEKAYAEFGLFRPAPPAATPTPSNSFTPGSKVW